MIVQTKEIILDYIRENYQLRRVNKCEKDAGTEEFYFFAFGCPFGNNPVIMLYPDEMVISYGGKRGETIINYSDPQLVDVIHSILQSVKK